MLRVKYHQGYNHRTPRGLDIIRKRVVKMLKASGESSHSARAVTLPFVIEHLEENKIPYVLSAVPGVGYHVQIKETKP